MVGVFTVWLQKSPEVVAKWRSRACRGEQASTSQRLLLQLNHPPRALKSITLRTWHEVDQWCQRDLNCRRCLSSERFVEHRHADNPAAADVDQRSLSTSTTTTTTCYQFQPRPNTPAGLADRTIYIGHLNVSTRLNYPLPRLSTRHGKSSTTKHLARVTSASFAESSEVQTDNNLWWWYRYALHSHMTDVVWNWRVQLPIISSTCLPISLKPTIVCSITLSLSVIMAAVPVNWFVCLVVLVRRVLLIEYARTLTDWNCRNRWSAQ